MPPTPLRKLRESMGFTLEEVAQRAGWSIKRQRELEADMDLLDASEANVLETRLGVSLELVEAHEDYAPPLATLLKANAERLSADVRFALAEVCAVAQELQALKARLGLPTGLGAVAAFEDNPDYDRHPEHGGPEALALRVREALGLEQDTTRPLSVSRDLLAPLGVEVLWQPMPPEFDAIAIASEREGAIIVANPDGAHMRTVEGRRITLAHELCHVLFDRAQMTRFARACAIERPRGRDRSHFELVERRARAFAPALLAPRAALRGCWHEDGALHAHERIQRVMARFGMSYSATRAHLENMQLYTLRASGPKHTTRDPVWESLDPAPARDPDYGYLRGLSFRRYVERAAQRDLVSRRWAEERLRGPLASPAAWSPAAGDGVGYASSSSSRR